MKTAHTPTPWVSRGKATIAALPESKYQGAPSVVYIATLEQGVDREANRGFLLRAVNCHDELVAALREIADTFDDSWKTGSVERRIGDLARSALAKANAP